MLTVNVSVLVVKVKVVPVLVVCVCVEDLSPRGQALYNEIQFFGGFMLQGRMRNLDTKQTYHQNTPSSAQALPVPIPEIPASS